MWKTLNYDGETYSTYEVSTNGEIRNSCTKHIRKTHIDRRGYEATTLYFGCVNGKKKLKTIRIHRAVACTFISNPESKETVNHIDGNKLNNDMSNLEWNTSKENYNHSMDVLGNRDKFRNIMRNTFSKKVIQMDMNDTIIHIWNSTREVERTFGYSHELIASCARGCRKSSYGFRWKYMENEV